MTHADGRKQRLGPGFAINLPLVWKGESQVITQLRQLYVITARARKHIAQRANHYRRNELR